MIWDKTKVRVRVGIGVRNGLQQDRTRQDKAQDKTRQDARQDHTTGQDMIRQVSPVCLGLR